MLPLEIQSIPHNLASSKARYWLEQVGLGQRLTHYPLKLSGGEQQRVAIARAFVTQPAIIFADEMTGNLDTQTGSHISDLIFSLNEQLKTTLIMVTHDEELAARCQRQLLLKDGRLHAC
jgi:putative ABC transport system ATP-binding protein